MKIDTRDLFWLVAVFPEEDGSEVYLYRTAEGEEIEIYDNDLEGLRDKTSPFCLVKTPDGGEKAVFMSGDFELELD